MKKIACLVLACLAAACSNGMVDMTYECSPSGATIIEQGGNRLGTCPVTVQYHPNDAQIQQGKFYTKKISAMWPDGDEVSVPFLAVDINSGHSASYTFMRGQDVPAMPQFSPSAPMPPMAAPPVDTTGGTASVDYGAAPPPESPMPPPGNPHIVGGSDMNDRNTALGAHQDQDWFDSLNRKVNCGIGDAIDAVNYGCAPKQ